jgi:hypothetical protein
MILESLDTVWEPLKIVESHFRSNYVRSYQLSRRQLVGRLRSLKTRGLADYRPAYGAWTRIGYWSMGDYRKRRQSARALLIKGDQNEDA